MKSIKTHLTTTLLLCILLPTSLTSFSAIWFIYHNIKDIKIAYVGEIASFRHQELQEKLRVDQQHAQDLLNSVLANCLLSNTGVNTCAKPKIQQFMLISRTVGVTLHSDAEPDLLLGADAIPLNTFQKMLLPTQMAVTSKSAHNGAALYSLIAHEPGQRFSLITTYSGQALQTLFINSPQQEKSGESFLVNKEGFFITRSRYPSEQGVSKPISAIPMQHCLSGENGQMLAGDYRDDPVIHGFRFVPEIGGGCLMAHISQADAFSPLYQFIIELFITMILFSGICLIIGKKISQNISNPIVVFTQMTQAMARGDFNQRKFSSNYEEIALLSQLFNEMAGKLDQSIAQLKASEQNLEQKVLQRTEQLEKRQRRYQALIESSVDGFWRVDMSGQLLEVNSAYARFSGYSEQELLTMRVIDLEAKETSAETAAHIKKIIHDGGDIFETQHRRKDGSVWDVEVNASYISTNNGYLVGFFRDITERKRMETELRIAAATFESQESIIITDANHIILQINKAFCESSGYTKQELIGEKTTILKSNQDNPAFYANVREGILSNGIWQGEVWSRRKNGEMYPVWLSITEVKNSHHVVTHYVGIHTDITERKQREEQIKRLSDSELNKAKLEAERASQAKSDFLASMSHELFTPMNAVLGFTQILGCEKLTLKQQTFVKSILVASYHLLDLIKEVLDFSIIEPGKLELTFTEFNPAVLVENCLMLMQGLAREKEVTIIDHLTGACHVKVTADSLRLKQVLLNLISNAIKYNRKNGSITVSFELIAEKTLKIYIKDTGIGISEEQLARLFQPFERLSAKNSAIEGAGLGLCISKKLMEAMKGVIGVTSVVAEGSCFWLEIPLS